MARRISSGKFFLSKFSFSFDLISKNKEMKKATKLRKKLFCIDGKSPDNFTKVFIKEKKKAAAIMRSIPLVLLVTNRHLSQNKFYCIYFNALT